jgi:hypothetical protein
MGIEQRDRQELWSGFGDTMARALEFVITPFLFGLGGFGLDRVFGTEPVLMIALAVLAFVGLIVRWYYVYAEEMRRHEGRLPGRSERVAS